MALYKTFPGYMVSAYQWFKVSEYEEGVERDVGYYRHPQVASDLECPHCKHIMHDHGFLDTGGEGQVVCPQDFIVKNDQGFRFAQKPLQFQKTFIQLTKAESFFFDNK